MSNNGNKNKDMHLGMSYGKAQNILRKNIIFNFVRRCKEDICFRCGEIIETVDELSIEHKIPWLYEDISLYWNLNNIAFSHIKCNRPNRPNGGRIPRSGRKIGPEGTAWCYKHKEFLSLQEFTSNISRWNKVNSICKAHNNEYRKSKKHFYRARITGS